MYYKFIPNLFSRFSGFVYLWGGVEDGGETRLKIPDISCKYMLNRKGYARSVINENIRKDEKIRTFCKRLVEDDSRRTGRTIKRIAYKIGINATTLANYLSYSGEVWYSLYGENNWPGASAIRKILNFYGYDLAPVIVEKQ